MNDNPPCYCASQSYLLYCEAYWLLPFDRMNLYFVWKSVTTKQNCLQVSRGRHLVQGSPADGPETSCCGQRDAGRQTALHSDSTDITTTTHSTDQQETTDQHSSIKCINNSWLLSGVRFYLKDEHCSEDKRDCLFCIFLYREKCSQQVCWVYLFFNVTVYTRPCNLFVVFSFTMLSCGFKMILFNFMLHVLPFSILGPCWK